MLVRILFLLILSSNAFSTTFLNDYKVTHVNVSVKSWKALRDFNIVKQDLDFSCGAASIATLLNNFYSKKFNSFPMIKRQKLIIYFSLIHQKE